MLLFSIADYSHPLVGGMLIGLSAVMLWWSIAKIAGISGIVASLWQPNSPDFAWQLAFFVGLLVSPWVFAMFFNLPTIEVTSSPWLYIIAGLLVGIGTGWAQGVPAVMVSVAMHAFHRAHCWPPLPLCPQGL